MFYLHGGGGVVCTAAPVETVLRVALVAAVRVSNPSWGPEMASSPLPPPGRVRQGLSRTAEVKAALGSGSKMNPIAVLKFMHCELLSM